MRRQSLMSVHTWLGKGVNAGSQVTPASCKSCVRIWKLLCSVLESGSNKPGESLGILENRAITSYPGVIYIKSRECAL